MQGLFDQQEPERTPAAAGEPQTPPAEATELAASGPAALPDEEQRSKEQPVFVAEFKPETTAENIRRFGLAWSAGIAFFGAIVFMLFIGWIADLLLGSSPWGVIGGIVFGSVIGFVQFFRITNRIFRPNDASALPLKPLQVADERHKPEE